MALLPMVFVLQCMHKNTTLPDDPSAEMEIFRAALTEKDPADRQFPGGRGSNEFIMYTPAHGNRTATNEWGAEAVIKDGVVRTVGGNNSEIPPEGFVLSGHGDAARWIVDHLFPGVEVRCDGLEITATVSDRTRLYYAGEIMANAEKCLASATAEVPAAPAKELARLKKDYETLAEEARHARSKDRESLALDCSAKALKIARDYNYSAQPSRDHELRACWYRLSEKNPGELEQTIRRLSEAGFNCLCPETIYWGGAIYPGAHDLLGQHPEFSGWDPLRELVRLCHQYNMKLVPWVEVYFIGFKESPLVHNRAEWLAMARNGSHPSSLEEGYYFFCPSREEVRTFWLEVYEHLLRNYEIDGLQLDYIRYPRSIPWTEGFCYCPVCREKFFNLHDEDAATINPSDNPELWREWNRLRMSQVTGFVRRVRHLTRSLRPDIPLSADVFPDLAEARDSKFQDWPGWAAEGYLDELYFMAYTTDAEWLRRDIRKVEELLPDRFPSWVGLGPYLGLSPELLLDQIRVVRESGSQGVCLFALEHLTDEHLRALRLGPFRRPALIPAPAK